MALKTITVQIEDQAYMITNMQTTVGLQYFRKLMDLFKDSVNPLVSVLNGNEGEAINEVIASLALRLGESDVEKLIKDMIMSSVMMAGQPIKEEIYETNFAGDFNILIRLLLEVIKHNYMSLLKVGATKVEVLNG